MTVTGAPVATRYTYDFVRQALPPGTRTVLEVGCGSGELAARLIDDGLTVLGIDLDAECVSAAKDRGVDARQLSWPAQLDEKFDAVLFTRSLHHVHDLEEGVAAARTCLRNGGRVIVEDFHAEGASARSNEWFQGITRTLAASGAFAEGFSLDERLAAPEPDQHHDLHSAAAINEALGCFGHIESDVSAYYFRYLESDFVRSNAATELLDHELYLIRTGSIDALGVRFVAH